ncbi:MAG: PCRF domain-containing protein, partial [Clostridia bacterium]|nr:PCRF domain-containing protein [Clostridia bacterium]
MFDKLSFIEDRFNELSKNISDPEVIQDQEKWRKLCKEHSDIEPIVEKYRAYKNANQTLIDSKE